MVLFFPDYCESKLGYVCQRPAAARAASDKNGELRRFLVLNEPWKPNYRGIPASKLIFSQALVLCMMNSMNLHKALKFQRTNSKFKLEFESCVNFEDPFCVFHRTAPGS